MINDSELYFTTQGSPYAPTSATDNIAPLTIDTAPLGIPTGSSGASTPGFNAGVNANAGRDLGIGGEMLWEVLITTSVTQVSGGSVFKLVTDSTPTISTINVLLQSPNLAAATTVAGYTYRSQLPASLVYLRYLGMTGTIVTNVWSAGAFESRLVMNIQQSDLYDTGFAVQ
jgi:hypothetical protein